MNERERMEQDRWSRIAGSTQTLVRSRLEIERILRAVLDRQTPVVAYFRATESLFMSRLRQADASLGIVAMEYGSEKAGNAAILAARSVTLSSNHGGAGIEFLGVDPVETTLIDGAPGIRIQFPEILLIQQRRAHQRISTLPGVPLRCIADTGGVISFEAEITDLSIGGFGAMSYDNGIVLEQGAVLRGCKVIHPGGTAIEVDIEICYSVVAILKDGTRVNRSGCRFLGAPERYENLVKLFVLDLERTDSGSGNGA